MLKIKKEGSTEGKWFKYSDGVEFKIRPLTGTVMRELRKTAVKINMELDPKTRRMIPVEDVNDEKLEEALADYILEDFKGVGDEAGNVFEPTLENKKLIMDQLPLKDFIWAAAQSLDVGEEQIKNSSRLSSGDTPNQGVNTVTPAD